ncbi:MAG TPA: hypothetical protein VJN69_06615 [Candidatus Acidoferrales bacterium]|nr:hypothetical protein [Candidatus Acidoferrales bacterium]
MRTGLRWFGLCAIVLSAVFAGASNAYAVPSFARQTGLPCSSCHTTIPELTPFGRIFKLNGYTTTTLTQISEKGGGGRTGVNIANFLPLSAFIELSDTQLPKPVPSTQNGSVEFPQQASLFLAGAFSNHIGGFIQVTYSGQDDHFSWDNTDVRLSNVGKFAGKTLVYGLTLNNNPTVEDLWNSTPAWSFPYVSSDVAPGPVASTLIDGTLGQDVAGAGAYAMWNDHLYGDVSIYRSEHLGGSQPNPGTDAAYNIDGVAPYWRLAWQETLGNNYLEVGSYGMHANSTPNAILGPHDTYTDVAGDFQYERVLPSLHNDILTVHGTFIHESSKLNATFDNEAADLVPHTLQTIRGDAAYHFGNRYAASVGGFQTNGTADATFYGSGTSVTGSETGNPKTNGYIANVSYWPVQNVQLGVQYTGYLKFNGDSKNYDGSGRNANQNNSLYLVVWIVF